METEVTYVTGDPQGGNETQDVTTPEVPWTLTPGRVPDTFVPHLIDRYLQLTYERAYNRTYYDLLGNSRGWNRAMHADACRREVIGIWKASGRDPVDLVTVGAMDKARAGADKAEEDYNAEARVGA